MPDTGAPWNLPYPSPSGLVRDAPVVFEDLAEAVSDGLDKLNVGFRFVDRRIFSTPGTFTFDKANPMGDSSVDGSIIRAYRIICVGGGGAGGGALAISTGQIALAGGGSSGAYAETFAPASDYSSTVEVIVGAAGTSFTGGAGGAGGLSSFDGANTQAAGGLGGQITTTAGTGLRSAPGTNGPGTVSGNITINRNHGIGSIWSADLVGAGSPFAGGNGGSSILGSGGAGIASSVTVSHADASGFGGGGGGRSNTTAITNAALSGGNASPGVVIVELYA